MIRSQCIPEVVYEFNYDGVRMNLAYEDIYYFGKNERWCISIRKKRRFHKY